MPPIAKKSKAWKPSIFAVSLMLPSPLMATSHDRLAALIDPALTKQMIKTSGFEIVIQNDLRLIFVHLRQNTYQVIGRFNVPEEAVQRAARNGEVVASDGTCITYAPNQSGFYPTKTCSYQVEFTEKQVTDLAYGKSRINQFFPAINKNEAIPAVGGREISDPIQVSTFNLDPKVNRALHIATAKVWLACWDPNASSDVNLGFDLPKTDGLAELAKCREAKVNASRLDGQVRTSVAEAIRDEAVENRNQSIADADKAQRDGKTLAEILDVLRKRS